MNRTDPRSMAAAPPRGVRERLRTDFQLATMTLIGSLAVVAVSGFAVFRFVTGNFTGGLVNCLIVLSVVAVLAYAWRAGNPRRAGLLFALITASACFASSLAFGRTAIYWSYLVVSITFVLAPRPWALTANLALIALLAVRADLFGAALERLIYVVTAVLITIYGWIFSSRYDAQRIQLQNLASHDPLTGAGNRRLLQHDLTAAVDALNRHGQPAVLAVLDLDRFKQVNDRLGHEAGDQVLLRLVALVRERLRRADGFYRFGGEEFVLLLPHTELRAARPLLEELHGRINAGLASLPHPVTVSIGAAALRSGEDWSAWLGRADAALYRAKQEGRNRVVLVEKPPAPAPAG